MTDLESTFSKFAFRAKPLKKSFTILAANEDTVATIKKDGNILGQLQYLRTAHEKAISKWAGAPLIINHGATGFQSRGVVTGAQVVPDGLLLSFDVEEERLMEMLNDDKYDGFSIGTSFDTDNPNAIVDGKVAEYNPRELSVIMYPAMPACPKGSCDIISMMTSPCTHAGITNVSKGEIMTETPVTATSAAPAPTPCKCKDTNLVSAAEMNVAMAAKDEAYTTLKSQFDELKTNFESSMSKLAAFEAERKATLISSLPEKARKGLENKGLPELLELVSFYETLKSEEPQTAGAKETPVEKTIVDSKGAVMSDKPWLPKSMTPGKYN